jgi:thiol-disulfide isomerase/thioredoxin
MIQTMNKLAVLLSLALLPALSIADTPKGFHELKIGDAAPDFELIGIDEEKHTLKDYAGADLLMIAFLSNHCPTSQAVEGRIKKLVKDYKGKGLKLVAINPNDPAALRPDELGYSKYNDSFPEMKRHAEEQKFNFDYLYDGDTRRPRSPTAASPRRTSSFRQGAQASLSGPAR